MSRSYDALVRLTRESQSIREGSARHVDYAYDKAANVLALTYPSGTTIATSYDALGRGDVLKRDGNQIADYDYLGGASGGRMKTLTFETGTDDVQLTQTFDGVGRLTRMTYAQTGNAGLPDFSYGFDAASNITEKVFEHRSGAPSEDYGYDTLHRLTRTAFGQRTSVPYEGFVYDHLGNHLVQDDNGTTVAGEFNAVNEQTKRGATPLSHDLRGNLTADDQGQVYFYDRQNLLTRVEDGSSNRIASYAYDALGRRTEKDLQGGAVTEFYWHGQQLVEETNATGTVQRKYVWSPSGGYIDDLVQFIDRTGGSDLAYFACRHHNFNIVALLSSSGGVVERYDYNPYGKRFVLDSDYSDDADGLSDVAFQIGHQGLMHDAETHLVYNRARMLHVVLGRFMQRDPLGYIAGRNMFEYVFGDPVNWTDASGNFPDWRTPQGRRQYWDIPDPRYQVPQRRGGDFRWHGNWGGPGWGNGGWNPEAHGFPDPGDPGYRAPVDARDACYEQHDRCIYNCGQGDFDASLPWEFESIMDPFTDFCPTDESDCIEECDHELSDCLYSLNDPRLWPEAFLFDTIIPWIVH